MYSALCLVSCRFILSTLCEPDFFVISTIARRNLLVMLNHVYFSLFSIYIHSESSHSH